MCVGMCGLGGPAARACGWAPVAWIGEEIVAPQGRPSAQQRYDPSKELSGSRRRGQQNHLSHPRWDHPTPQRRPTGQCRVCLHLSHRLLRSRSVLHHDPLQRWVESTTTALRKLTRRWWIRVPQNIIFVCWEKMTNRNRYREIKS